MSSCPGYNLEIYLAWMFDITVDGMDEPNFSVGMAEMLGTTQHRRRHLTREEFAKIVELFEDGREIIEDKLLDYEEDHGSWRTYGNYPLECAFKSNEINELEAKVQAYLATLK